MKQVVNLAGIGLYILTFSPVAHGHIAAEHSFGYLNGIIHMLTDPVHVAFWIELFVFLMLVLMRKKVIVFLEWCITIMFRR